MSQLVGQPLWQQPMRHLSTNECSTALAGEEGFCGTSDLRNEVDSVQWLINAKADGSRTGVRRGTLTFVSNRYLRFNHQQNWMHVGVQYGAVKTSTAG